MLNPSLELLEQLLEELKEIAKLLAKNRHNKGYKIKSINKLLSILNASESVKKSEKNFDDTESTRNKDYDADEILKTTKPDPAKTKKDETINKRRKS